MNRCLPGPEPRRRQRGRLTSTLHGMMDVHELLRSCARLPLTTVAGHELGRKASIVSQPAGSAPHGRSMPCTERARRREAAVQSPSKVVRPLPDARGDSSPHTELGRAAHGCSWADTALHVGWAHTAPYVAAAEAYT